MRRSAPLDMSCSYLRHSLSLASLVAMAACGGRSFPGSQDDPSEFFPVDGTLGEAGGVAGGSGGVASSGIGGTLPMAGFSGSSVGGSGGAAGVQTGGAAGAVGGASGAGGTTGGSGGSGGSAGKGGSNGAGGTAGKGGSGGSAGKGGAPEVCHGCIQEAFEDGACPDEQVSCQQTSGCQAFGQCMLDAGCLNMPNPPGCAQQAGCKGSQPARQAFRELASCLICNSCQGACPVLAQQCIPEAGGSSGIGGNGGASGSIEEQCAACQETAFPICKESYYACLNNPGCNAILNCFQGCDEYDKPCYQQCWQENPTGQQSYYELYACFFCTACGDTCGQLVPEVCGAQGF
jgi:hypothetical protein